MVSKVSCQHGMIRCENGLVDEAAEVVQSCLKSKLLIAGKAGKAG